MSFKTDWIKTACLTSASLTAIQTNTVELGSAAIINLSVGTFAVGKAAILRLRYAANRQFTLYRDAAQIDQTTDTAYLHLNIMVIRTGTSTVSYLALANIGDASLAGYDASSVGGPMVAAETIELTGITYDDANNYIIPAGSTLTAPAIDAWENGGYTYGLVEAHPNAGTLSGQFLKFL